MGLGLIGLLVVSLAATLDFVGSFGKACGVDEEGLGSDKISFSSPKYTPSGLGARSGETASSVAALVVSPSTSFATDVID